ncbi:hypothetical protein BB560_006535, partial [Smittium megazygosporum]
MKRQFSGLQKDIFKLYRQCLRTVQTKPTEYQGNWKKFIRSQFEKHRGLNHRDVDTISHFLHASGPPGSRLIFSDGESMHQNSTYIGVFHERRDIAVPKFKGDSKDTWLLKAAPFFEYLYMMETDDVRQLLAKFGNYDTMENYEKWEKQIVETLKEDWEKKQHQNEKQGNSVW